MTSLLISNINGIKTTIEVDARNKPNLAAYGAICRDKLLASPPACEKDFPARRKNPFIPPTGWDICKNPVYTVKNIKRDQSFGWIMGVWRMRLIARCSEMRVCTRSCGDQPIGWWTDFWAHFSVFFIFDLISRFQVLISFPPFMDSNVVPHLSYEMFCFPTTQYIE